MSGQGGADERERRAEFEAQIRAGVEQALAAGPAATPEEQEARVERARRSLAALDARITELKGAISGRRRAVEADRRQLEALPLAERVARLPEFQAAAGVALSAVAALEAELSGLYSAQWQATQRLEVARIQLAAMRGDV